MQTHVQVCTPRISRWLFARVMWRVHAHTFNSVPHTNTTNNHTTTQQPHNNHTTNTTNTTTQQEQDNNQTTRPAGGRLAGPRHAHACRAGDRSAQDHSRRRDPAVSRASRAAAVEQLVGVPVPEMVILARGTSALGLDWCQVAVPGWGFWWQIGTRNTRRDPRRDSPPGQGGIQILDRAEAVVDPSSSTWRCLSFSSSTEWRVFQLVYRDRATVQKTGDRQRCSSCGFGRVWLQ